MENASKRTKVRERFDRITTKHGTTLAFALVIVLYVVTFYFYRPYAMELGQQVEDTSLGDAKKNVLII